jgi:hypothetical protein
MFSLHFASNFFAISLQPFRFKTKNSFSRYFPSTFSLQNTFFTIMPRLFRFLTVLWIRIQPDPDLFGRIRILTLSVVDSDS